VALGALERVAKDRLGLEAQLDQLRSQRDQALAADLDSRAAAELAGKRQRPTERLTQLAADLEAAEGRAAVLERAEQRAREALNAAVAQHGEEWEATLTKLRSAQAGDMARAVDALMQAHEAAQHTSALLGWVRSYPRAWRGVAEGRLRSPLPTLNGEALAWSQLARALREHASSGHAGIPKPETERAVA